MEKDSEKLFRELKEELTGYVKLRSDLVKITLYEKTAKAMSVLLINLLIIISGYFTLLFISILAGVVLAHLLHSWFIGFGIVTVIYIILFFTLAVFRRKQIQSYFTDTVAKILFNEFEE
jgi:hypothetical protein